jgi:hypothetical protein
VGVPPTHPDPAPILQSGLFGILSDVLDGPFKFAFVPDQVIVILPLPKAASAIE